MALQYVVKVNYKSPVMAIAVLVGKTVKCKDDACAMNRAERT